ncbi:hypothetical protein EZV62_012168 [Acer yangbiense]|uniref:Transposase MuDR plant domain-containing protein n=1 Tax=Acer yangbiense TaxID=1000413 RepID=A0A5C7HVD6_9ROSI|nr:hypothetical protein EZV62_012168 [Acer yangbiense]
MTYDALVKLVQDADKVDAARIENDNDVSCMMDEDKLLPEVYITVSEKENSQASDTDNRDDVSIPDVDRCTHKDEDCNHGMGAGSASAGPSGFAIFSEGSFGKDGLGDSVDQSCEHATPRGWIILGPERYSLEPTHMEESISNDGCLYKCRLFQCKKNLKRTLHMYALKEQFEVRIKRSSKTRYKDGCKDVECEFQLRAFKIKKGEYWVIQMFVKDHTCNIDGFHAHI